MTHQQAVLPCIARDLAQVLESFQGMAEMEFTAHALPALRVAMDQVLLPGPPVPLHVVEDMLIPRASGGHMQARLYRSTPDEKAPMMVFFHGGGWCIGSLQTHDGLCRHLAYLTGMNVCSVAYRLAPEHVFPAALNDAYDAVRWLAAHASSLHCDPQQLMVAGDSAGGNLAMACSLRAKHDGWAGVGQQLLLYPVCDVQAKTDSYQAFGDIPMLTSSNMQRMWQLYCPEGAVHSWASVGLAPDLQGLPPTVLVTAELDILRDEGEAMAQRLMQAGVPTTHIQAQGMVHGFANFSAMVPSVEAVLRQACAALLPTRPLPP